MLFRDPASSLSPAGWLPRRSAARPPAMRLHRRPAAPSHVWEDDPGILGGRDLVAGGTWLCLGTASGKAACLTNFRQLRDARPAAPSRGALPVGFVRSQQAPAEFLSGLDAQARCCGSRREQPPRFVKRPAAAAHSGPDCPSHASCFSCRPTQASTCWPSTWRSGSWLTYAAATSRRHRRCCRPACTASQTGASTRAIGPSCSRAGTACSSS